MKLSTAFLSLSIVIIAACSTNTADSNAQNTNNKAPLIEHLNAVSFKQKVFNYEKKTFEFNGKIPAIVDFYATWCGPCKKLSPILEELAVTYKDKINIYKVDTDKEQNLSGIMGIQGIPALFFFPANGGQPFRLEGYKSREELVTAIEQIIKDSKVHATK